MATKTKAKKDKQADSKPKPTDEELATKWQPLVMGNDKLGKSGLIWHFSLAAILTCVGRSNLCEAICYACGFLFRVNAKSARVRDIMRNRADFVRRVCAQITANLIQVLRVHVSGDFDTVRYIRKWIAITKKRPNTEFYAYTRSWRERELIPVLQELADLPNFTLWYSCDRETGKPPEYPGVRHAYLAVDDDDEPPFEVDLVFRDDPKTYKVKMGNAAVCPEERKKVMRSGGTDASVKCERCRLCWGERTQVLDRINARIRERALPVVEAPQEQEAVCAK